MNARILTLLLKEHWAIEPAYAAAAMPVIEALLRGEQVDLSQFADENFMTGIITPDGRSFYLNENDDNDPEIPENSIAVVGVSGVMQKFGGLCSYGTEELAAMLTAALAINNISGAVLRFHTPGGTVSSIVPLKKALQSKQKPVVALVDSMCASAGYYVASMADAIIAVDELAEVGSIGVMAALLDDTQEQENMGRKRIEIYAPQSGYKNKPQNEALNGNTDLYAQEVLAPLAINFQNHVKSFRAGKLNEKTEGILEGKMFYAEQAVKAGLIDKIGSMDEAVETVRKLATRNQILQSIN